MSLNRVELQGTLTRDPAVTRLPSGVTVTDVTIAVNDAVWDSEARAHVVGTTYVVVQFWDTIGAQVQQIVHRGDEVFVIGRLDQREVTKADGSKDKKTRVQVLSWQPTRLRARSARPAEGDEGNPWA